jgi:hypothetical protein
MEEKMKLVNVDGRTPAAILNGMMPRACICNTGANTILQRFGDGDNCACQCKDTADNNSANHQLAIKY